MAMPSRAEDVAIPDDIPLTYDYTPRTRRHAALAALRATGWPGVLLACFALMAIIGPWVAPHDPLEIRPLQTNLSPGKEGFLLGTDNLGRDLLSRTLHGAGLSLFIGLVPVIIATIVGLAIGALAAFGPRSLSYGVMRLTDIALAFPAIMLAIAVAAMLGPSLRNAILAMVLVLIPSMTRIARTAGLDVLGRPYMSAARLSGASETRMVLDFALPNMLAPVLVYSAANCGLMIIFAAGLSFLGVGVQPPTAEWGRMVADGRNTFLFNPWPSLIPGLCIFGASLMLNLTSDRLRDYFDPRLR